MKRLVIYIINSLLCLPAIAGIIVPPKSTINAIGTSAIKHDSMLLSATDNGFYYCKNGDSILYFHDQKSINGETKTNIHASISTLAVKNTDCVVSINELIVQVDTKHNRLITIASAPEHITALTTGIGDTYFYGTASKLYFLSEDKTSMEIAEQGVENLWRTDSILFITFTDKSTWTISCCDAYNKMAEDIRLMRQKNPIAVDGYLTTTINDGDSVNLSDLTYTTIPGQGLFGILGNHLVPMEIDKTDITEYAMPDSTYMIDQILILQNMFIYKSGSSVLHVNSLQRTRGFSLDSEDFSIAQASDTSLYILTNGLVYECDARRGNPKLVFTAPTKDKILLYKPIGTDTYAASGTSLYVVKNGQCHVLAKLSSPITCINFSGHGIWIGTNHGLYQYQGYNKLACYSEQSIQQLLDEGDKLYIITDDSNIYRLQKQPQTNTKKKTKSKNR